MSTNWTRLQAIRHEVDLLTQHGELSIRHLRALLDEAERAADDHREVVAFIRACKSVLPTS